LKERSERDRRDKGIALSHKHFLPKQMQMQTKERGGAVFYMRLVLIFRKVVPGCSCVI
jgi:hypothetical protein